MDRKIELPLSAVNPGHWARAWERMRKSRPLIYAITNFVAASFQANVILAAGGVAVMSRNGEEAGLLGKMGDGLLLNAGTPPDGGEAAMRKALSAAKGRMVLLDPVGYGLTPYRKSLVDSLLLEFPVSLVKGNHDEVRLLAGYPGEMRGVDSGEPSRDAAASVKSLAVKTGALVCATGAVDYVSDGVSVAAFRGGSALVARITGGGCALGALMITLAAGSGSAVEGSTAALAAFRRAAELAEKHARGPASFQACLIDEIFGMTPEVLLAQEGRMALLEE